MRSERGNSSGFAMFWMFLLIWWFVIMLPLLVDSMQRYDTKAECLEEWSACQKTEEIWEPTDKAERN